MPCTFLTEEISVKRYKCSRCAAPFCPKSYRGDYLCIKTSDYAQNQGAAHRPLLYQNFRLYSKQRCSAPTTFVSKRPIMHKTKVQRTDHLCIKTSDYTQNQGAAHRPLLSISSQRWSVLRTLEPILIPFDTKVVGTTYLVRKISNL